MGQYLNLPVVNQAVAGRSARSYTVEGRFSTIINEVKAGDFVIIEFGHNDGTSSPDNGREDAVGDGYNTVATVTDATYAQTSYFLIPLTLRRSGTVSVIHTFNYYIQNAVTNITARGANAIVSSQTPDNIWTNGAIAAGPRFQQYAKEAAANTGAPYVDHYSYVAQAYEALGETTVNTYYPIDHTHTSVTGKCTASCSLTDAKDDARRCKRRGGSIRAWIDMRE